MFARKPPAQGAVKGLKWALAREFRSQLRHLRSAPPQALGRELQALGSLARLRAEVEQSDSASPAQLAEQLEHWIVQLWTDRSTAANGDVLLGRTLLHLAAARRKLEDAGVEQGTCPVLVPTDVLFQLHHTLFPAERMAVIAGRQLQGQFVLTACFDVTSEEASRVTYSRADPSRLAAALLSMEQSGSRLAAWAHSHPGATALATHPSGIDRRQWAAWSEDYKQLLGLILTGDGCVRLWGEPVETGEVDVRILGQGCRKVEGNVYQLGR